MNLPGAPFLIDKLPKLGRKLMYHPNKYEKKKTPKGLFCVSKANGNQCSVIFTVYYLMFCWVFFSSLFFSSHFQSLNFPEENDETMSKSDEDSLLQSDSVSEVGSVDPRPLPTPARSPPSRSAAFRDFSSSESSSMQSDYGAYQPRLGLPAGYGAQTPFPSQAPSSFSTLQPHKDQWLHSSSFSGGFSSTGRPSCLVSGDYCSYQSKACFSHSLPDGHSADPASLEQPRSLHSIPMDLAQHSYYLPHCSSQGAPCSGPAPGHAFWMNPSPHPDLRYRMPYSSSCKCR